MAIFNITNFCSLPAISFYSLLFFYSLIIIFYLFSSLVQAQYWHDPYDEESYVLDCVFLPDINQELVSLYYMYMYLYT